MDYVPDTKERTVMFSSTSRKLIVAFASVLALMLIVGVGTALAAQRHTGVAAPFKMSAAPLVAYATPAAKTKQEHLIGIIQSIDQTKKTFTLLETGQTKAVTIAFDAKTTIDKRYDKAFQFAAKAHVMVDVTVSSNGSLYATEIDPAVHGYGYRGGFGPHGTCPSGTRPGRY
jgi:Domain of unknown function (DUF5666)